MKSEIKVRTSEIGWEVIRTFPFKILGNFNDPKSAIDYRDFMEKCLLSKK